MYVREIIGDMGAELREETSTLALMQGDDLITITKEQALQLVSFINSHGFIKG